MQHFGEDDRFTDSHHQHLRFRHRLDCVANTFATEAGILHTTVRHVVDAKGWIVVHNHRPDFERSERVQNVLEIVREDPATASSIDLNL